MNYYKILLIFNIFFLVKYVYKYTINYNKHNVNELIISPMYGPIVNNYDELNKLYNMVLTDIIDKLMYNDYEFIEYEFNILCIEYYNDYICNEYNTIKYNMSLKQIESNVINYLHYIFNNISIYKKKTDVPCCNIYVLTWVD